jgi:hypothetical protein
MGFEGPHLPHRSILSPSPQALAEICAAWPTKLASARALRRMRRLARGEFKYSNFRDTNQTAVEAGSFWPVFTILSPGYFLYEPQSEGNAKIESFLKVFAGQILKLQPRVNKPTT